MSGDSTSSQTSGIKPMFINPSKKYGLIINKPGAEQEKKAALPTSLAESLRNKKPLGARPCIFDEDDDDDEDADEQKSASAAAGLKAGKNVNQLMQGKLNVGVSGHMKKKTQIEIEKALSEDANVFEYDAIYDEVEKQKGKLDPAKARQTESKEPKYMAGLMKAAAKRRMEFEKLQEKKIQKEREAEGDLWGDKEVFVTSAYRQKLEERQKIEEEERRQEELESLLDVRRQKDLSGFYTSMLKIRSGEMVIEEESEKEKRIELEMKQAREKEAPKASTRQFRAKKEESDEEEDEPEEEAVKDEEEPATTTTEARNEKTEGAAQVEGGESVSEEPESKKPKIEKEVKTEAAPEVKPLTKAERRELRRKQLFTKRTVGEKFDAELAEYFIRKSTILSLKSYIERDQ